MGWLVMTDPFHHYRRPGPTGEPGCYLALPDRAALLGGPLLSGVFFYLYGCFQNVFIILSFILIAFSVDCMWRCLVKSDPGSDKRVRVLYFNIRGLHANLDELVMAGSDYDVFVCAESKVSDRRHLSELRIPGWLPTTEVTELLDLVPRVWLFMLRKDSALSGRASWSILAMNLGVSYLP